MAFPPLQKSFGFGDITIKEISSVHDINKLVTSITKETSHLRIEGKEIRTRYSGEIVLTDDTIRCGDLKLSYKKVLGIAKDDSFSKNLFTTFEIMNEDKHYRIRLQISAEKLEDLFRFLGNRIESKTEITTDAKFAKGFGKFFKERLWLDLDK